MLVEKHCSLNLGPVRRASKWVLLSRTQLPELSQPGISLRTQPRMRLAGGKRSGLGRNDLQESVLASSNWESARNAQGGRSAQQINFW